MPMPPSGLLWFLVGFNVIGFGILSYGLYTLRVSILAGSWPTTMGRVVSCELVEHEDSDGNPVYHVAVRYAYAVGGNSYEGDRIAFGYAGTSGRASHQEVLDRFTSAQSVLVRYDPKQPSRAVLSYGVNRSTLLVLIAGATWVLFMAGFTALWFLGQRSDSGLLANLVTE